MSGLVQHAVDRMSARLGLSLLVEDIAQHPVWWSTVGPVDEVRTSTVLDRRVGRSAADVVREYRLRDVIAPVRTPAMPERGMWARWAVPVRRDDRALGLLWVLDPEGAVTDDDLVALTELAELAADALATAGRDADDREQLREALLARLLRGPDRAAAVDLVDLEGLPDDPRVQVELPARAGGWGLPGGASAHVVRSRARTATSGAPLPLVDLAEAVRRAVATRRAVRAGAELERPTYDQLGSWLLVVEAPESVQPSAVHPAVADLLDPARDDLRSTAWAVLELGGDVTAAAGRLHLHRTTLYYRLDRIRDITGVDLRDPAGRADLHAALRLAAYRSA